MKRDFKGVWIPKEIWINKNLKLIEKVFLVEINSLDNADGCFAKNSYFAEFFSLKTTRVSQIINNLVKKGYINAEYQREGREVVKRVLTINCKNLFNFLYEPLKKSVRTPLKNCKDNNTINNTINNIYIYWNSKNIIKHKEINNKIEKSIKKILKTYSQEEIKKTIDNYSEVLKSNDHFFDYKWSIYDFLNRGFERFHDNSDPWENFKKKKNNKEKTEKANYTLTLNEYGEII